MVTPLSTYRLQLRPGFGFDAAAGVVPYLADLGVTHAYCSPYLQAAPGSAHGYDVVDHSRLNEELGGAAGHARLCAALRDAGLGQVLDVVPNHMAITPENRWWTDVLENGPASLYAGYFDVDWGRLEPAAEPRPTVLMPVLEDHYGGVLEDGKLAVEREEGAFVVRYADQRFPLAPRSLRALLEPAAASLPAGQAADELAFLASAFAELPPPTALHRDSRRHRDKEVLKLLLGRLCRQSAPAAGALDAVVDQVNGDVDLLDQLLRDQNYRLSSWRVAGQEIDYRRFFDVSSMVALRVEDDQVFDDTHALVLRLVAEGVVDGLRVDHPDGLLDPAGYLRRLAGLNPSPWVVVEKILGADERLPSTWPVAGTTGYDFLNVVGGLFVDPAGEVALDEAYSSFTGETAGWTEVAHAKRHEVMGEALAADVQRVLALLVVLSDATRRYRDFTRPELDAALREVIAGFSVYRTYVGPDGEASDADRAQVAGAVAAAARDPEVDPELLALLGSVLLGRADGRLSPQALEVCLRAQQLSGPVMAKGVEDTAFYSFNRLVSLNEVGGDPSRFGTSVAAFHERMVENQRDWPGAMLSSSTHDTKRSEDVRARISLLSEIPKDLAAAVRRWAARNEAHRTTRSGVIWPDRNLEWLLYQTLVGAHPLPVGRALAYVEKATREAKVHTSWVDPDPDYDEAVRRFVEGALADRSFLADLDGFVASLVEPGWRTSLAAQMLKLTAPGVPDVYQGTELWDDSLVDPDNRRPVDFECRRRLSAQLDGLGAEEAWERAAEGLPKLLVTRTALRLRRRLPAPFGPGEDGRYEPVASEGAEAGHVVAFVRGGRVATVVPRLVLGLQRRGGWADTSVVLPAGRWRQELTGGVVEGGETSVASLLAGFPVALLVREVS